ncbi:MAG: hypothetical protein PHQ52_07310 [Candidatus Omnitrophica bacterium]|nr:hypothetical protein [Candidatus Omnitrophota bacterium]
MKTNAIKKLEEKMEGLDFNSIRHSILENAKNFKTSWIELGQSLYTVWKDKLYKDWGYNTFDIYTAKEVGVKKNTAAKLLKSYFFLEKQEPEYIKKTFYNDKETKTVPSFESIDLLRRAHANADIDKQDYKNIRNDILEKGKDITEVKKDLVDIMQKATDLSPLEERQKRRLIVLKRFLGTLRSLETEIKVSKLAPVNLLVDINSLLKKIEIEIK